MKRLEGRVTAKSISNKGAVITTIKIPDEAYPGQTDDIHIIEGDALDLELGQMVYIVISEG
jgi:hypothetical protein